MADSAECLPNNINLFKQTELKIAFKATNTIQQQITEKQAISNPSGVYKLKCNA